MIEFFRLSTQQKHLWLLQQGESCLHYRTQGVVFIEGILDVETLEIALHTVINRHEILRTIFKSSPGEIIPFQVIADSNLPPIHQQDLSAFAPSEQEIEIAAIWQKFSQLHFDLEQTPNLDVLLIILSPQKHLLLLSLPSLCADSVTLKNLVQEISYYYGGLPKEQLQQEPMQYADYSEWQHELLAAEDTKIGRDYWRKQDISAIFNLKLPGENQSDKSREFQPKSIAITIEPHTVAKLEILARQYETSISVFLQTIWHIWLWRLTGQSNLIVGNAYDGRQYEELQRSLGLFARYLPIHSHLEANLQFLEVLTQIHESTSKQYKWQNFFNWDEIGLLNGENEDISWLPISYDFGEEPDKYFSGNTVFSIYKQLSYIDKFKLNLLCLLKKDNELLTEFCYDSSLFRSEDIKRWAEQFQILLESAIANPYCAISKLEIISELERQQLLFQFNNTKTNYSKVQCIHQLFEKQVDSTPNNVAVVFENKQLTYAQLNASANQLAGYLQNLGVGPEVLVAICLERSHLTVIALLAILKAGGAYIPLDSQLPKERQAFILEDTQATVILSTAELVLNLPEHRAHVVSLDADWDVIAQKSSENLVSVVSPENLIYVLYTSGSTGKPKGVAIEHQQMFNYLNGVLERIGFPTSSSYALVTTFSADAAYTNIFCPLCTGGCLHIISQERAADADAIADYFHHHGGIDFLKIVPSYLQALLSSCQHPAQILPRRCLMLGGESSSWNLIEKVQALAPDCTILNHYGPTEATVGVLTYQVENGQRDDSATVPLGRPLANTQIFLLDEHLQPVPIGVPGELYIGGANLARGYFNRPDLTKQKFIPNPFRETGSDRLYQTGDLARYLSDGNIEFLGRIDHQVKIRGFRIELGEIETALRQHQAVRETVAIALDDERGEKRLVAYVVPYPEPPLIINELRSFLQKHLPDYMLPSAYVKLDALPLMLNGKLNRHALPTPNWTHPELEASFIAPRTPEEQLLADIWAEVLGVEQVGVQDNFFELGGDSILSIQIAARAKEAGLNLTPMQLFKHQTIAQLSAIITKIPQLPIQQLLTRHSPLAHRGYTPSDFPLAKLNQEQLDRLSTKFAIEDIYCLSPLQQGLLFHSLYDSESRVYFQQKILTLQGKLNATAFRQAWQQVVNRYPSLRSIFIWQDLAEPIQIVLEHLELPWQHQDWRDLSPTEQEQQLQAYLRADAQEGFSLSEGPLMRLALIQTATDIHQFIWSHHHILLDGWSTSIIVTELFNLYEASCKGQDLYLKDSRPYRDYIAWLQQQDWSGEESFWRKALSGLRAPTKLDAGLVSDNSSHQDWGYAQEEISLSIDVTSSLQSFARQHHLTLNTIIQGVWALLLSRYSGEEDVIFGVTVSGRPADLTGVEAIVGLFINSRPIRVQVSSHISLLSWLRQLQQQQIELLEYQYSSLVQIQGWSEIPRGIPLFNSLVSFQNHPLDISLLEQKSGLKFINVRSFFETNYPLSVTVEPGSKLLIRIDYLPNRFDAATIHRILEQFQTVLKSIPVNSAYPLSHISLSTETIKVKSQELVTSFNADLE